MGSAGIALLVACVAAGSVMGCSKKKTEDTKASPEKAEDDKKKKAQGDRYADGKRLEATLKDWTKRWAETEDLPACDPLLKDAAQLELCKSAAASLVTLKAAVAKGEPQNVLVKSAAEVALATESASEKLRTASMEKMQAERKTAPAGSSTPGKPGAAGSAKVAPRPVGSTSAFSKLPGAPKLADKLRAQGADAKADAPPQDPAMQVMQAYSRVNRSALRYISQFLQFGPLPTRKLAFTELEGLSSRKENWPALGRTLREAAMAENDPDLQGKLKALAPKLSRRTTPGTPGAGPGGMPPGHPPMAPGAAAAAPPAPAPEK